MVQSALRLFLACFLLTFALLKLTSTYQESFTLPYWAYYGVAAFELLAGLLFFAGRYVRITSIACVAFFGGGGLLAVLVEGDWLWSRAPGGTW